MHLNIYIHIPTLKKHPYFQDNLLFFLTFQGSEVTFTKFSICSLHWNGMTKIFKEYLQALENALDFQGEYKSWTIANNYMKTFLFNQFIFPYLDFVYILCHFKNATICALKKYFYLYFFFIIIIISCLLSKAGLFIGILRDINI